MPAGIVPSVKRLFTIEEARPSKSDESLKCTADASSRRLLDRQSVNGPSASCTYAHVHSGSGCTKEDSPETSAVCVVAIFRDDLSAASGPRAIRPNLDRMLWSSSSKIQSSLTSSVNLIVYPEAVRRRLEYGQQPRSDDQ